jgi:hypothetical protein
MATPNKKMYDRKGKLIFDPNNPEDVRRQEEINKQIEMAKELFSIVDPRGGGGIGAMAKGISKAALANMAKSKFAQNKATQILELFGKKPMTRGKKAVTKKATNTVKEVAEKPVEIVKETLSRLLKPIPKLNKSKSFTTAKAKNALDEIPKDKPAVKTKPTKSDEVIPKINRKESYSPVKSNSIGSFKIGESAVGTSQTSKIIPEVIPTTIPKATEFAGRPTFGPYSSRARVLSKEIYGQKDVYKNLRAKAAEKAKEVPEIPKEKLDNFSKLVLGTAGLGIAGGIGYQGYQGVKNRTDREKVNPIELNNVKESDLRDSTKYKDVKILKTSTGDKGIIKDPKTGKWKYFNEKEGVLKGNVGLGDGPPIGLNDNNQNKGNNQGSNKSGTTTPRSKTGQAFDKAFAEARKQAGGAAGIFEWNGKKYGTALKGETVPKDRVEVGKTTTPLMGDEEYKKDPRLATLRQQDDDRQLLARAEAQKKEMMEFEPTEVLPFRTKPLSSLVFKTAPLNPKTNSRVEPVSYTNIETNSKKLKKKSYGGNLAMLKYMK